jgi:hypothetical protein
MKIRAATVDEYRNVSIYPNQRSRIACLHILNWAKKNFIGTLIESNGYRLHHCEFRTGEYFLLPHHATTPLQVPWKETNYLPEVTP